MCLGLLALCPIAQGSIAFSFADPIGGRQLTNIANGGGPGIGRLSYSATTPIVFIIDAGVEGTTSYPNARLEFNNMDLGAAQTISIFTMAPVTGSFTVYDLTGGIRTNIVTGTANQAGAFMRVGDTSSMMFSSGNGFFYTAGPALVPLMGGLALGGLQEATFTITDILTQGGLPVIGAGGVFNDFVANTSYSGNTGTVPAPGSLALMVLGAGMSFRRRR